MATGLPLCSGEEITRSPMERISTAIWRNPPCALLIAIMSGAGLKMSIALRNCCSMGIRSRPDLKKVFWRACRPTLLAMIGNSNSFPTWQLPWADKSRSTTNRNFLLRHTARIPQEWCCFFVCEWNKQKISPQRHGGTEKKKPLKHRAEAEKHTENQKLGKSEGGDVARLQCRRSRFLRASRAFGMTIPLGPSVFLI